MDTRRTIEQAAGNAVSFSGGGRGQRAEVWVRDEVLTGLGTSREAALESLRALVEVATAETPTKVSRTPAKPGVDDIVEKIQTAQGKPAQLRDPAAAPNGHPEPVWRDGRRSVAAVYPCSAECLSSEARTCRCNCRGTNHGLLWAIAGGVVPNPVVIGPKPCAYGCGGITQRKWVPGHDARAHSAALSAAKAAAS